MHGQRREDKQQQKWHMWPEPLLSSPPALDSTHFDPTQLNSFSKAGRKISIGDCALFQAENAPPFIGIIRKLITDKEGNLKLSVNWLYRPSELKLGKGASVEAAPNEIFYSFHKDEISAAYLLHPCKVAFLRKGSNLPPGLPSFICRRVYDTANKCLYWLTEQDYTDEHQAEVDQLLDKTKQDMQTSAHSQGISQRASNTSTSSKADPALSNQVRGKKRDRNDQNVDSGKREKLVKVEEPDSKKENSGMHFEDFAALADKEKERGLSSMSLVEQLVQVMTQERNEGCKKMADVVSRRALLAGIIAATEKEDCLTHLVQLGALPVLDDWLQEAHKGKLGDGSPKESDKGLEDLLLTLLRALDKLPVDLDALKTCMIGKSVNNLKNYKNTEIQKKARKLVDTWKKRVESEMNSSDEGKSGLSTTPTWSSKPSNDTQGSKVRTTKNNPAMKLSLNGCGSSVDTKYNLSSHLTPKDNTVKAHASVPNEVLAPIKEEKSCSSSQSHTNSQSWCSGAGKGFGSVKEEVKTPLANRSSATSLRLGHSHSSKSHTSTLSPRLQRETSGKHKTSTTEKGSSTSLDKGMSDGGGRVETPNNQRLIVRIPNPARSPAHSVNGGSFVDATSLANNRLSSPGSIDKHDSVNVSSRAPVHSPDTSGDAKCGGNSNSTNRGSSKADSKEEIDRSDTDTPDEVHCKSSSIEKQHMDQSGGKGPSDSQMMTITSAHVTSTKSVPTISKTDTPSTSNFIEGGIGLLASVATSEGPEHEKVSAGKEGCPHLAMEPTIQNIVSTDPACKNLEQKDGDKGIINGPPSESAATSGKVSSPQEAAKPIDDPQGVLISSLQDKYKLMEGPETMTNSSLLDKNKLIEDAKDAISPTVKEVHDHPTKMGPGTVDLEPQVLSRESDYEENMPVLSIDTGHVNSSFEVAYATTTTSDSERFSGQTTPTTSGSERCLLQTSATTSSGKKVLEETTTTTAVLDSERTLTQTTMVSDSQRSAGAILENGQTPSLEDERPKSPILNPLAKESLGHSNAGMTTTGEQLQKDDAEISNKSVNEVKEEIEGLSRSGVHDDDISNSLPKTEPGSRGQTGPCLDKDECKDQPTVEDIRTSSSVHAGADASSQDIKTDRHLIDDVSQSDTSAVNVGSPPQRSEVEVNKIATAVTEMELEVPSLHLKDKENMDLHVERSPDCGQAVDNKGVSNGDASSIGAEVSAMEETMLSSEVRSLSCENTKHLIKDADRPVFDLNEGFDTEDVIHENVEQPSLSPAVMSSDHNFSGVTPQASSFAAPIATVSATKGAFIPPSDLVKTKAELGWKGSAATSAFRPAEPRRVSETGQPPLDANATNIISDAGQNAKQPSRFLDIDLNIADERGIEDTSNDIPLTTSSRPELDLNQVDESEEGMVSAVNVAPESSSGATRVLLDFDLNDGPGLDQEEAAPYHQPRKAVDNHPIMPMGGTAVVGTIQNQADVSRWYYPAISVSSSMMFPAFPTTQRPDSVYSLPSSRPIITAAQSLAPYNSVDIYPASTTSGISYTTTIPPAFSYGGYPFGVGFPPSTSTYNVSSTYNGTLTYNNGSSTTMTAPHVIASTPPFPTGGVPSQVSHYPRPYFIGSMGAEVQGGDATIVPWVRPNLDLNAGPDVRVRDNICNAQFPYLKPGSSSSSSSSISSISSSSLSSSSLSSGGVLKRKDPDGGFDQYNRPGFKQMTWQ